MKLSRRDTCGVRVGLRKWWLTALRFLRVHICTYNVHVFLCVQDDEGQKSLTEVPECKLFFISTLLVVVIKYKAKCLY